MQLSKAGVLLKYSWSESQELNLVHNAKTLVGVLGILRSSRLSFMCREEDAAAALTSGIAFRRKVQALCGTTRPLPSLSGPQAR